MIRLSCWEDKEKRERERERDPNIMRWDSTLFVVLNHTQSTGFVENDMEWGVFFSS